MNEAKLIIELLNKNSDERISTNNEIINTFQKMESCNENELVDNLVELIRLFKLREEILLKKVLAVAISYAKSKMTLNEIMQQDTSGNMRNFVSRRQHERSEAFKKFFDRLTSILSSTEHDVEMESMLAGFFPNYE